MTVSELVEKLATARQVYYGTYPDSEHALSDAEYDALEERLRSMEPDHPFLAGVGFVPDSKFEKVKHGAPMGSLNKAQNAGEMSRWYSSCAPVNRKLVVSDKCDGASISLRYVDGALVQALTRGDGEVGEDITRNVMKMKGVVPVIRGLTGYARGEIVLLRSDWKTHFPTYSNPRNAAVGIAKRIDGEGSEHLTVLHYQIIKDVGAAVPSKLTEFKLLERIGAAVPRYTEVASLSDVEALYEDYCSTIRESLDYDIDGLVVEFDDLAHMANLGDLNHRPKGAIAFKFPHDTQMTTLRDINWQVGNSGRVTPVAVFDEVNLAGARVTNASLANLAILNGLRAGGLRYGEKIMVSRRNDVIPKVEKVLDVFVVADPVGAVILTPSNCPCCNSTLWMQGEYLMCKNTDACPAQVSGSIKRWVEKLGLLGWGDEIIDTLCEQGFIQTIPDIYKLKAADIEGVQMSGRRIGSTAGIVLNELNTKGKVLPLHIFVGALGIPLCARSVCRVIVEAGYDTLDKMMNANMAQIAAIPGLGAGKAESFVGGLAARADLITELLNYVTIKGKATGHLAGASFCLTGFRDKDMTAAIEAAGGAEKGSVGKGLTYLVTKEVSSTSGKAEKARSLGIQIISPAEAWAIIRQEA